MKQAASETELRRSSSLGKTIIPTLAGVLVLMTSGCPTAEAETPSTHALSPVVVDAVRQSLHDVASEAERVGPANQPEWTTRRVFAETDIYVIPPGEIEFNQFYISSHPRHGEAEHSFESELEFGLPWRTQFDVEVIYSIEDCRLQHDATVLEIPHALADWGKIPLNPAVNFGWRFNTDEADAYFFRLLLAEEFGPRLHFGADLAYQPQIGGEHEREYELNVALSYVAIDSKLSVGGELLVEYETSDEENDEAVVLLGPSVLYKPTRNTHLGLVALFGLTHDSPVAELFFTFGIDFEPFAGWGRGSEQDRLRPVRRPR